MLLSESTIEACTSGAAELPTIRLFDPVGIGAVIAAVCVAAHVGDEHRVEDCREVLLVFFEQSREVPILRGLAPVNHFLKHAEIVLSIALTFLEDILRVVALFEH